MNKKALIDIARNGLYRQNPLLVGGMVIAPAVVFATTLERAAVLAVAFSVITFYTLLFSSFVSQRIVYTVRIILYTLIGALVFIPAMIILYNVIPGRISDMGIFFPLLITNSLIVSCSETTFFQEKRSRMLCDVIFNIIGYDIAVLLFGLIREVISTGEISGNILAVPLIFKGVSSTYGGFILLGIFAAALRGIFLLVQKIKS